MMTTLEIQELQYGSADYKQALAIRNVVLRKPLGLDIANDDLTGEQEFIHFGAYREGNLIGTLYIKAISENAMQVKQVAVLESERKGGVGSHLMEQAEQRAKTLGFCKTVLDARADAAGFYSKKGYQKTGEQKIIFRIPHFRMEKEL